MKATVGTTNGSGRSSSEASVGSRPASREFRLTSTDRPMTLDEVEKRHIQEAIVWAGGNKTRAAAALGIDRRTLFRKLAKYKGKV